MESPDDVYDWVDDDVEDLEFYCQGGYYPITISDTLQSPRTTYVVLHKLGFGSYSTVWLAQDTQTSRLVSLKIGTAHAADEDIASRSDELTILAHLADNVTTAAGSKYILSLLDSFEVESPNGTHTCLVMEPQGPSILDFCNRCEPYRLPGGFARIVCPQLATAVEYLHSRGIVHGGSFSYA
jgi:serine/threonine-protein kinase SRPK3